MASDREIEEAAKAIRLRDSTDEFACARAALAAAEKVRADEWAHSMRGFSAEDIAEIQKMHKH